MKDKKYRKVRDHCCYTGDYRGAAHSICNLKYSVPKKILVALHNGSNYDNHLIMKELAEEFKKQFTCLGENAEKTSPLQSQYKKKLQELIKMEKKFKKNMCKILQFIDSARSLASSLSNFVNNLFEGIHRTRCKYGHDKK